MNRSRRLGLFIAALGAAVFCSFAGSTGATDFPPAPLYFTCDSGGNWDVYRIRCDGSRLEKMTATAYDEKEIALDPNRQKLAVACSDGWIRLYNTSITTVLDSFTSQRKPGCATQPSFSDSGVLFVELSDPQQDLWTISEYRNGKIKERVRMYGSVFYPTAIPGSGSFVYTYNVCTQGCPTMITELWRHDSPSSLNRQLTLLHSHIGSPAFIDARRCVFTASNSGPAGLFTIDLSTGAVRRLLEPSEAEESEPAFSPGGRMMAYIEKKGGKTAINIFDFANKKLSASMTPVHGRYGHCAW